MTAETPHHLVLLNWRDRRHPSAGGAELYCERVARELVRRGHRVTLVTSRPRGLPASEVVDGYRVRRGGGWVTLYPFALAWLLRHRGDVDAVVDSANGVPFFSPLVLPRAVPVVLLVHRVHQDLFSRALPPLLARVARWLEGPATRTVYGRRTVVVMSPSTRATVRRQLGLRGPVRVVPGGADTRDVVPQRAATPRIVVVGRLSPYKRLDTLVAAVAQVGRRLPGTELHLVGDGAEREALEELAERLGARAVFHGRLPDAARDEVLATAWLTVSASDGGDWALSLLEANAAGVPSLARRVTGMRDTVRHGETGWLVDEAAGPGDDPSETLAHAVTEALTQLADPREARRVSEGARAWAGRFTWEGATTGVLSAVRSEARRAALARTRGERRAANDVAVVVDLPREALPEHFDPATTGTRVGDRWAAVDDRVVALLAGADEEDARGLLARLHVDLDNPSLRVLVARHADVVDLTRTGLGRALSQPGGPDGA